MKTFKKNVLNIVDSHGKQHKTTRSKIKQHDFKITASEEKIQILEKKLQQEFSSAKPDSITQKLSKFELKVTSDKKLRKEAEKHVLLRGKWNPEDKESFDVLEEIYNFLASTNLVLTLRGDAGAGKTTLMKYFYHASWEATKQNSDPIVLFVPLG